MTTSKPKRVIRTLLAALPLVGLPAANAQTEVILPGATSPNGFVLPGGVSSASSSFFAEIGTLNEEAWISVNEDYIGLMAPCDAGCLRLWDQDGNVEQFTIFNDSLEWPVANTGPKRITVNTNDDLYFQTNGAFINFYTDLDGDTGQADVVRFFNNSSALTDRIFQMDFSGNVEIDGSLTQNFAFDLAETFWMSEPVSAGEVAAVDPSRPDAVRRAQGSSDRAVIGVVTARPGVVLGGGAFSVEDLQRNWGAEIAQRFVAEVSALETQAFAESEYLQDLRRRTEDMSGLGGQAKAEDRERIAAEVMASEELLAQEIRSAALDLFFERNFVHVALAGRVPVKVGAGSGVIEAGDFLAAGWPAGTVAKATDAGPVLGIALETHLGGAGEIMMLVQRGWYGGDSPLRAAKASESDELARLRRENAELELRLAALEEAVGRLGLSPRVAQAQTPR